MDDHDIAQNCSNNIGPDNFVDSVAKPCRREPMSSRFRITLAQRCSLLQSLEWIALPYRWRDNGFFLSDMAIGVIFLGGHASANVLLNSLLLLLSVLHVGAAARNRYVRVPTPCLGDYIWMIAS